ncbi:iron-containing alcohol dehydrogenase [Nocardioides sp.]|uniref:iron-containing alcohol dehydrogenase n=1 Tax=Nocardioides sp. TaxID=35761 RepID=UPI0039E63D85
MPTHEVYPVGDLLAQVDPEGRLAACGLRRLVLGSGAIETVADTVAELLVGGDGSAHQPATVTLLIDPVPMTRLGVDVKQLVEDRLAERYDVRRVVLDDGHPELHVVDDVVRQATEACTGAAAVVALGGGTISDIGKLAAAGCAEPPVVVTVQTAASVDGFTDDVSVLLRDGVKRTVPARWPDAVVADSETIAQAPSRMNRAGFGEMTSMLTAPADWRLASLAGTDPTFHEGPIRLLGMVGEDLTTWAPGVRAGDPDSVAALTKALALRGVVTGVSGTTAVLSGVEHLVSHMLDQHHTAHHQPMGLHGAQVGAAAVVAAAAWELLFERLAARPGARVEAAACDADQARRRVEEAFAGLGEGIAAECWRDYARKLGALRASTSLAGLLAGWPTHEPGLRRLVRPSAEIAAGLLAAGAPATPDELDPRVPAELWRWAVANCALMRNRVTVVDLLMLLGWWRDADVDEVLARAAQAVARAAAEPAEATR